MKKNPKIQKLVPVSKKEGFFCLQIPPPSNKETTTNDVLSRPSPSSKQQPSGDIKEMLSRIKNKIS